MIDARKDPGIAEDIEYVLSQWSQPTEYIEADEQSLSKLASYVPDMLIRHWRVLGFSVFREGMLTIANPLEWQDTVDEWIADTELEALDRFIPLLKSAYGEIELFGVSNGISVTLMPTRAAYVGTRDPAEHGLDIAVRTSFGDDLDRYDYYEESCNFQKALKKLGPLKPNEIYGFVPVLPMGGMQDLDHLQKVDAFAHLSILRQVTGELRAIMEYADLYR